MTVFDEWILISFRLLPMFIGLNKGPLQRLPGVVRAKVLLVLSLVISVFIDINTAYTGIEFIKVAIGEFFIGALLYFPIVLAIASISFWGRVLDMQIGFGAAGVMDPTTNSQEPLIGTFYSYLALVLFYVLGLHTELLAGVLFTYEVIEVGRWISGFDFEVYLGMSFFIFVISMYLFLPMILVMWCLDIFIGFLSRTMPQMNIYFVMLPFKIFIGITVVGVNVLHSKELFALLYDKSFFFIRELGF